MELQSASVERTTYMSILYLVLAFFAGIVITLILAWAITSPARKGREFAQRLAAGDITQRVDIDQKMEAQYGPPKRLRIREEKVITEFGKAGFILVKDVDFLPEQYYLEFRM